MKLVFLLLLATPALAQIKMPKHAHAVPQNYEWECDEGYVQHRKECVKVVVPKKGVLTPDGHGWDCQPGHEKYRDECRKTKKKY